MERFVKSFWNEDSGNATIDWMVLTAGLVLLGAAVMATISSEGPRVAQDSAVNAPLTASGV